ncbi:hypothetical protein [Albidovulum sp.]|uniref:hypothetical protein n=1 Tax=Albidovulum sp. TaxID=1872424 RepID=UPI0039B9B8B3
MNRTVAILAAILVVLAVWYFGFRSQPVVTPEATTTTETTTAPATTTETTTAPATTTETTTAPATTTETTTAPAATTETTTAPAAAAGDIAALLDPATFDADKLIAAVDASTLDDAAKSTLKTAIEGARNNPGAVQAVIDQVKAAMGM